MTETTTKPLVIVGTAEGRCVLDAARAADLRVAGFIDLVASDSAPINDCPVLGGLDRLEDRRFVRAHSFVVTIGDCAERRRLGELIRAGGGSLGTIIHPRSIVSPYAQVGQGATLLGGTVVNPNSRIGDHVILDWNVVIGHDSEIEDGVFVAPGVQIGGRVRCRQESFIGLGATIVPDVTIGEGATIGAGAVVLADVPPQVVAVGNPAKIVKRRTAA